MPTIFPPGAAPEDDFAETEEVVSLGPSVVVGAGVISAEAEDFVVLDAFVLSAPDDPSPDGTSEGAPGNETLVVDTEELGG